MTILLPALAVAIAAFCIWLGVRVVNRRERWAKRTALGLVVLLAYPMSFGPACWFSSYFAFDEGELVTAAYKPILRLYVRGPHPVSAVIDRFAYFASRPGWDLGHDMVGNEGVWANSWVPDGSKPVAIRDPVAFPPNGFSVMNILLPALAVAFAAFCVWLGVRIFNRRERWATMTAVTLFAIVAYLASFGPAYWLVDRGQLAANPVAVAYRPVLQFLSAYGELEPATAINWYASIGAPYDPDATKIRLIDAAGLVGFSTGPPLSELRHAIPYRSNDWQRWLTSPSQ